MTSSSIQEKDVFLHLSHRPRYIIDGFISVDESVGCELSNLRSEFISALGRLDNLPLEVLHESLKYLDVKSLRCLASVSRRGESTEEA